MKVIRADDVPSLRRSPEQFTGSAHGDVLYEPGPGESGQRVNLVLFEPGSRTWWHRHASGQAIYVTAGTGFIKTEGVPGQTIRAGDLVVVSPGEWHWHGATPANFVLHLTVNPGNEGSTEWSGRAVGEDDYRAEIDAAADGGRSPGAGRDEPSSHPDHTP